ncbi:hypothetical protein [Spartinivicinus ruber]|uniref:hypothetical protein n=1 Tax=Spartinivicinus ruber TaxID=2683272 RepID=UPI0013D44B20|nr:hypothetical protein [Spartinivicinus ruber]
MLIADMQFFAGWEIGDYFTYDLNVALDIEGDSEIIFDFSEADQAKPWSVVWQRETKRLVDSVNKGEYSFFLLPTGDYNLDITSQISRQGDAQITHNLRVVSGEIGFIEAAGALETFYSREPIPFIYKKPLPNGIYSVTYNIFRDTKNIEVTIQPVAGQAKLIDSLQNPFQ